MGRPNNPDLTKYWKICLPATLAGKVEFLLMDPLHKKPTYGARAKLITELLEQWVTEQSTTSHHTPTLNPETQSARD